MLARRWLRCCRLAPKFLGYLLSFFFMVVF